MTTDRPAPISGAPANHRKEAPVADDLMKGYRRIVAMRGDGTPDKPCARFLCGQPAGWRVGRLALCDSHGRATVRKIKNRGKK